MKLLTRYLARKIYSSILLVFAALIMLFALLDLVRELNDRGKATIVSGMCCYSSRSPFPGISMNCSRWLC